MIRLLNAYFPGRTVFLGITEALLISLVFIGAAVAQFGARSTTLLLGNQGGALKIVLVAAAFIICMAYFDLYNSSTLNDRRKVMIRLMQALVTVYFLLAFLYFLFPPLELGRRVLPIGFVFVVIVLMLWRNLFSIINSAPRLAERTLLIGEGPLVELLNHELERRPELGVRVVGRLWGNGNGNGNGNGHGVGNGNGHSLNGEVERETAEDPVEVIAGEMLSRTVATLRASRIIIAMGERRGKLPVELLLSMKCHGVGIQEGTDVYEEITGKVPIESIRLSCLLFSPGCRASRALLAIKRAADLFFAVIGSLLSLPLLPFVVLAIKLTSKGPVLYRQRRVGKDGKIFECYKFRTMRADAEADTGPTWALDDDPRITRVGKFLRLSRMDEIPQLWNVAKGDMSLVGPRPERPEFVDGLGQAIPYYSLRHSIRPGITGWAQIRYKYGNTLEDSKEKLRYDLYYIRNMSIGLDILIFFNTLKVIMLGKGAK